MKEKTKQLIYEGSSFNHNYHKYELTEDDINVLAEEIEKLYSIPDNALLVQKIEDLITEWKKAELPDEKVPFSEEAEIAAGFKFFMKWLKFKYKDNC